MKKLFHIVLFLMLFSLVCFAAEPIYKYESTEKLTETTTLTNVREFYADYNISYSYVKMDLEDERVGLELLKSDEGTDVLESVNVLAEGNKNTVAAINGDFFSVYSGKKGFALGIEKNDGKIVQSPINPATMATVAYDGRNVLMSYLDFHVMVVAPNWEYKEIRHINKHTSYYGDILMYTREFGNGYSPAPGDDVLEVVVEDGLVKEFRRNMEPCEIPENGCVLVVSEGSTMFFANNFNIGDAIKFDYYITPDLSGFDTALGAGSMLVYEGQDVGKTGDYTHTVAGLHPRSAVGVDKEGRYLYLVAVDGRQESSRGMRMSHLAELLIELGCYTAVNLDGGGSTNMVASTMWQPFIHSVNSPTESRRVINALGVVLVDNESEGENEENESKEADLQENPISGIFLKAEMDCVFAGQKVDLSVCAYDDNMRPVDFDSEDVIWYCSEGEVDDLVFLSDKGGKITISASLGEHFADTEIYVVDEISGIVTQSYLSMEKGDTHRIEFDVFDYSGRYLEISDKNGFEIVSTNDAVAAVDGDVITAVGNGNAQITISRNNIKSHISVAVGSYPVDFRDGFESVNGSFLSYPRETKGAFSQSDDIFFDGEFSGMLSFDFTEEQEQQSETEKDGTIVINENDDDVKRAVYYVPDEKIPIYENCNEICLYAYTETDFGHTLKLQLSDANGRALSVDCDDTLVPGVWTCVTFTIPESFIRPLSFSRIYVLFTPGEEKDKGEIYLDNLELVSCTPYSAGTREENTYRYNVNNSGIKSSVKFGAVSVEKTDSLVSYYKRELVKRSILADDGIVISENMEKGSFEDENALYISLDTSKGGIRNTDSSQWNMLTKAISETERNNIFILTSEDIFGSDDFENSVVEDYLASIEKNVFVISCSDSFSYKKIKGVSYFTLDCRDEQNLLSCKARNQNVAEFFFGDVVTFEICGI